MAGSSARSDVRIYRNMRGVVGGDWAAVGVPHSGKTFRGIVGVKISSSLETVGGLISWSASSLAALSEAVSSSDWGSTEKYDLSRAGIACSGGPTALSLETSAWQHGAQ